MYFKVKEFEIVLYFVTNLSDKIIINVTQSPLMNIISTIKAKYL